MIWTIVYRPGLLKSIRKLDNKTQESVRNYLEKIANTKNPEDFGKPLSGNLKGFWRYRVGDYRIVCDIIKKELVILLIEVEHRSRVYKN